MTLVPLAKEPFTTGLVIWYSAQRSAASASASSFSAFSRSRAAETAATDASKYRTVATRPNLFAGFKETSNPSVTFAPFTAASSAAVAAVAFGSASPPSLVKVSGAANDSSRNAVRSDASLSSASWNHALVGANPASKNVSVSKESVPSTGFAATPRNDVRNAAAAASAPLAARNASPTASGSASTVTDANVFASNATPSSSESVAGKPPPTATEGSSASASSATPVARNE